MIYVLEDSMIKMIFPKDQTFCERQVKSVELIYIGRPRYKVNFTNGCFTTGWLSEAPLFIEELNKGE